MKPYLWHPKLVIKLIDMPCNKRKPGNAKIRVLKARNVSKNGVKIKRCALLHRDIRRKNDLMLKSRQRMKKMTISQMIPLQRVNLITTPQHALVITTLKLVLKRTLYRTLYRLHRVRVKYQKVYFRKKILM